MIHTHKSSFESWSGEKHDIVNLVDLENYPNPNVVVAQFVFDVVENGPSNIWVAHLPRKCADASTSNLASRLSHRREAHGSHSKHMGN